MKPKNKRGAITDILVFIAMAIGITVFFGLWIWGTGLVTDALADVKGTSTINVSYASSQTFEKVDSAQQTGLSTLAWVMIICMGLTIVVSSFMVKSHPAFLVVYLFVTIGAIIGSVYISNAYETLLQNALFGGTLSSMAGASFLLLNLPIITAVIGVFGMIFLMAGIVIDRGQGGSVI